MLKTNKEKDIYVLHYEEGKHITSKKFKVVTHNKKEFSINFSGLFLPLQLHEESKDIFKKLPNIPKKYIIPYGGDLFALSTCKNNIHFLSVDIMGHGFRCHTIADHLTKFILKHRKDDTLMQKLNHKLINLNKDDHKKIIQQLTIATKEAEKLGHKLNARRDIVDNTVKSTYKEQILNYATSFTDMPGVAACQCEVDLDNKKINFLNLGNPSMHCILMDHEGNILGYKSFTKRNPILGFMEDLKLISEEIKIPQSIEKFRIVIFTDAIEEQKINIPENHIEEVIKDIDHAKLQVIHKSHLKQKSKQLFNEDKILQYTIRHLNKKSPKEFVDYFYKYLIHLNNEVQGDDLTLVVADFEEI